MTFSPVEDVKHVSFLFSSFRFFRSTEEFVFGMLAVAGSLIVEMLHCDELTLMEESSFAEPAQFCD